MTEIKEKTPLGIVTIIFYSDGSNHVQQRGDKGILLPLIGLCDVAKTMLVKQYMEEATEQLYASEDKKL